jgi:hypothetical protein
MVRAEVGACFVYPPEKFDAKSCPADAYRRRHRDDRWKSSERLRAPFG